jgi:hypothetical protein
MARPWCDAHLVPMCRILVVEETETLMESIKNYISNTAIMCFKVSKELN